MTHAYDRAADLLRDASHVANIEFYVIKSDNKPAELCCRLFGTSTIDEAEMKALACELNTAIAPVRRVMANSLHRRAIGTLSQEIRHETP